MKIDIEKEFNDKVPTASLKFLTGSEAVKQALLETIEHVNAAEAERAMNEETRLRNEDIRDAHEQGRWRNEDERIEAEKAREGRENTRRTEEVAREVAESARVEAERVRSDSEYDRFVAEGGRVSAENGRVTAENLRVSAENGRVNAEKSRATAESGRANEEGTRVSNENTRKEAEATRVNAEKSRVSAETLRINNENARIDAENARAAKDAERDAAIQTVDSRVTSVNSTLGRKISTNASDIAGIVSNMTTIGNRITVLGNQLSSKITALGDAPKISYTYRDRVAVLDRSTGSQIFPETRPEAVQDSSGKNILQIISESIGSGGSAALATNITYSELKALRDNGGLNAGQVYRITDYRATTITADTSAAGHGFDILAVAIDGSHLSEECMAARREGDTYFKYANLSAWKVWYSLDNDTARFAWADTANGKGVIYRLIDEYGNDCPYDFKNIRFKRFWIDSFSASDLTEGYYAIKASSYSYIPDNADVVIGDYVWAYTFAEGADEYDYADTDNSVRGARAKGNIIEPLTGSNSKCRYLNNIVFYGACESNHFGPNGQAATIYNSQGNYVGRGGYGIIAAGSGRNIIGSECNYITMASSYKNIIGAGVFSATLIHADRNDVGTEVDYISINEGFDNKVGNYATEIGILSYSSGNVIGPYANLIRLEQSCNNRIGNYAVSCTIINGNDNTIEDHCQAVDVSSERGVFGATAKRYNTGDISQSLMELSGKEVRFEVGLGGECETVDSNEYEMVVDFRFNLSNSGVVLVDGIDYWEFDCYISNYGFDSPYVDEYIIENGEMRGTLCIPVVEGDLNTEDETLEVEMIAWPVGTNGAQLYAYSVGGKDAAFDYIYEYLYPINPYC